MSDLPSIQTCKPKDQTAGSEWNSYRAAKYRCTHPNASDWKYYGGRGIKFLFESFEQFINELGAKPSPKHTVDRIDVNKHYEPGNVKWADRREQANNMRRNKVITAFGETLSVAEWSRRTGIRQRNIHFRQKVGWCLNCTLSNNVITCTHGYNRNDIFKISARNRPNNHLITAQNKTLTQAEWSEISGLGQTTISNRIKRYGWCSECAVTILARGEKCPHKDNF